MPGDPAGVSATRSADLAFAADPIAPPETLASPPASRARTPRPSVARPLAAGSGSLPVSPWSSSQGASRSRRCSAPSNLQDRNALFAQALRYSQRSRRRQRSARRGRCRGPGPRVEVAAPDFDRFYLVGSDVPPPLRTALVYGIWLSDGVDAVFAGTFVPEARA